MGGYGNLESNINKGWIQDVSLINYRLPISPAENIIICLSWKTAAAPPLQIYIYISYTVAKWAICLTSSPKKFSYLHRNPLLQPQEHFSSMRKPKRALLNPGLGGSFYIVLSFASYLAAELYLLLNLLLKTEKKCIATLYHLKLMWWMWREWLEERTWVTCSVNYSFTTEAFISWVVSKEIQWITLISRG